MQTPQSSHDRLLFGGRLFICLFVVAGLATPPSVWDARRSQDRTPHPDAGSADDNHRTTSVLAFLPLLFLSLLVRIRIQIRCLCYQVGISPELLLRSSISSPSVSLEVIFIFLCSFPHNLLLMKFIVFFPLDRSGCSPCN